jgi:hypothetical protein
LRKVYSFFPAKKYPMIAGACTNSNIKDKEFKFC